MGNLISTGVSFYLEVDGVTRPISYEEYLTFGELHREEITEVQVDDRIAFYKMQHEYIPCPLCDKGLLRRDIVENDFLMTHLHDSLDHETPAQQQGGGVMLKIGDIFSLEGEEPLRDIATCSECGWRGPVQDCGKEKEGDWESGFYGLHTCPKCEDGGCIDDYEMSENRKKEWQQWYKKNVPAQQEGVA